jgi:DNA-binding NarL/FixJ family response regulator
MSAVGAALAPVRRVAKRLPHLGAPPDGSAVEVIAQLAALSPGTKVVVLTSDSDAETLSQALDAGAAGYVHKSRSLAVVRQCRGRVQSASSLRTRTHAVRHSRNRDSTTSASWGVRVSGVT